jgi:hypothetical protein
MMVDGGAEKKTLFALGLAHLPVLRLFVGGVVSGWS